MHLHLLLEGWWWAGRGALVAVTKSGNGGDHPIFTVLAAKCISQFNSTLGFNLAVKVRVRGWPNSM